MLEKVEKYSNKVDFVIMRKGKYEERSLDLEKEGINNLMQGRGNIENMNMYPGDRKIIKDNPIFQLHMVMLKEDFYLEDNLIYESGIIIQIIAFGIPSNLIVNILDSEKKFISRKNNS